MINITCPDLKKLSKKIENFSDKQLPYAATKTVNDTAFEAKREIQSTLGKKLKLKNKHTVKGIGVKKAKKNKDLSKIKATVYNKDPYLAKHEKGGSKRAKRKHHAISVDKNVRTKRGYYKKRFDLKERFPISKGDPGPRRRKKGDPSTKPMPFIRKAKSGKRVISIRYGAGQRKIKNLFLLHKGKTRYKERGVFSIPGKKIGRKRMPQIAMRNLILAYNTSR